MIVVIKVVIFYGIKTSKNKKYIRIVENINKEIIKKLDILISILERKYNNIEKHKNKKLIESI